eukprot:177206_1
MQAFNTTNEINTLPTDPTQWFYTSSGPKQPKEPAPKEPKPTPFPKQPKGTGMPPPSAKGINNIYWRQDEIILTSIQCIAIIICILPIIIFIYLYCKKDERIINKSKGLKVFFTFLIICCICFALTALLSLINGIFLEENIYQYDQNSNHYNYVQIPLQVLWVFTRTLMYIFFTIRLHFAYATCTWQYSPKFIATLVTIISIVGIFQIITKILGHLHIIEIFQGYQISIIMLIKEIIISLFLLYLFVRVLLKLITVRSINQFKEHSKLNTYHAENSSVELTETDNSNIKDNVTGHIEMSPRKKRRSSSFTHKFRSVSIATNEEYNKSEDILETITKVSILSFVALISTVIVLCVENILSTRIKYDSSFDYIVLGMFSIDSAINAMCIYLSFAFAKYHYRFLCKYLNKMCLKCCKCIANINVTCSDEVEKEFEINREQNQYWTSKNVKSERRESQQYQTVLNTSNEFKVNNESKIDKNNILNEIDEDTEA